MKTLPISTARAADVAAAPPPSGRPGRATHVASPIDASPPAALAAAILDLLPQDGTPVLNRVMRTMLGRRGGTAVSEDAFFEARELLLAQGKVGRLRGQGGSTFRDRPEPVSPVAAQATPSAEAGTAWTEAALMAPLRRFLEGPFAKSLDLPESGACIVHDTSASGPHRGKWARPDFILVSAMRFRLLPGVQLDLHSFELKTESGGGVLAIHEALAQTRFTHFGHFVWHLPANSKAETMLDDIVTHCEEHGIGLIRMRDPAIADEPDGCEVLVDPRRKPTLGSVVDDFLDSRLSGPQKAELRKATGAAA